MAQVTVVIPNYNGIKYLEDCLASLYGGNNQEDFEILIVDNGSTDGSVEWMKDHYPQTRLICLSENTGFCHAVNVGITESDSPYVILLNNDTKSQEGFVDALVQSICQDEKIFSVSAKMLMWDKPELLDGAGDRYCAMGWAYARGKGKAEGNYNHPCKIFSACGGAAIYRKSILDKIGLFDEQHFAYLEDLDLGYRARIYGYYNIYEPKAKVIHYGSASTGSRYNSWKTKIAASNSIYVVGKNMPLFQKILNFPFLLVGFLTKYLFFCKKGMGKEYKEGLKAGFEKLKTPEGRAARVKFSWENLGHYLSIQGYLYAGILQLFTKK